MKPTEYTYPHAEMLRQSDAGLREMLKQAHQRIRDLELLLTRVQVVEGSYLPTQLMEDIATAMTGKNHAKED